MDDTSEDDILNFDDYDPDELEFGSDMDEDELLRPSSSGSAERPSSASAGRLRSKRTSSASANNNVSVRQPEEGDVIVEEESLTEDSSQENSQELLEESQDLEVEGRHDDPEEESVRNEPEFTEESQDASACNVQNSSMEEEEEEDVEDQEERTRDKFHSERTQSERLAGGGFSNKEIPDNLDKVQVNSEGRGNGGRMLRGGRGRARGRGFQGRGRYNNNNGTKILLNPFYRGTVSKDPNYHLAWESAGQPIMQFGAVKVKMPRPLVPTGITGMPMLGPHPLQVLNMPPPQGVVPLVSGGISFYQSSASLISSVRSSSAHQFTQAPLMTAPALSSPFIRNTVPTPILSVNVSRPPPSYRPLTTGPPPPQPLMKSENKDWLSLTDEFLRNTKESSPSTSSYQHHRDAYRQRAAEDVKKKYGFYTTSVRHRPERPESATSQVSSDSGHRGGRHSSRGRRSHGEEDNKRRRGGGDREKGEKEEVAAADLEYLKKVEDQKRLREQLIKQKEMRRQMEMQKKQKGEISQEQTGGIKEGNEDKVDMKGLSNQQLIQAGAPKRIRLVQKPIREPLTSKDTTWTEEPVNHSSPIKRKVKMPGSVDYSTLKQELCKTEAQLQQKVVKTGQKTGAESKSEIKPKVPITQRISINKRRETKTGTAPTQHRPLTLEERRQMLCEKAKDDPDSETPFPSLVGKQPKLTITRLLTEESHRNASSNGAMKLPAKTDTGAAPPLKPKKIILKRELPKQFGEARLVSSDVGAVAGKTGPVMIRKSLTQEVIVKREVSEPKRKPKEKRMGAGADPADHGSPTVAVVVKNVSVETSLIRMELIAGTVGKVKNCIQPEPQKVVIIFEKATDAAVFCQRYNKKNLDRSVLETTLEPWTEPIF